jgi:hypothetical protein
LSKYLIVKSAKASRNPDGFRLGGQGNHTLGITGDQATNRSVQPAPMLICMALLGS